ncbi:MAG TPA: putative LPS assembly protein LptD [Gemmatimonadota bacterium]|nr:putative LPS assembly protein LptD [Gemmatimonadota bacterium]
MSRASVFPGGADLAFLALLAGCFAGPSALAAQERDDDDVPPAREVAVDSLLDRLEAIEALPDTLLTDSLIAVRDSLAARRDSLAQETYRTRRGELSGGDFPEKDALFEALAREAGYEIVEYRGEVVRVGVPRQRLELEGRAQLNRAGDVLVADTIRYLGEEQFIVARKSIELLGSDGNTTTSDSILYYDVGRLRGTLFDAESSFDDGGNEWRIFGNVIPLARDTVYATSAAFTSCDLEEPHYTFRAGELKMVTRDVLVAWPVVLYISRVPVFWLPFFAADIRQGRRSGIIPPRFGVNDIVQTSGQTSRNISDFGYYWAINDYLDAQATLDWFSGNYTRVNGAFRYRFLKQFVRGSVLYSQSFSDQGDNLRLQVGHDQELGLNTTFRASVNYVQDTRIFQDQSINPTDQTRTIDSDVGLNHRFSFGNLQASADRRQELDGSETATTLPRVNLSILPITLFGAPRGSAGPFNNITLDASTRYARRSVTADSAADRVTTTGGGNASLRIGNLNLSSRADIENVETTPQDSLFQDLPSETRTTLSWNTGASFRIGLVGSTTLSPTASLSGTRFRSEDTGGDFVSAPGRASLGAGLTTDVYGFLPGFGPFSRIRHKVSPRFDYAYSPAVEVDSALAAIPGFPGAAGAAGAATNTLSIGLNQTFEAKLGRAEAPADTAEAGDDAEVGAAAASVTAAGAFVDGTAPTRPKRDRIIQLLGIRTSALRFDFERAKRGEPVLVSDRIDNSLTSDLLSGLSINLSHDLFEGSGDERRFAPFLTALSASFSLSSGQGLADIFGLGSSGRTSPAMTPTTSMDRYSDPEIYGSADPFEEGAGPWNLSLNYGMQRARPEEGGAESQSLSGNLSFRPTTSWSIRWNTQYNLTDSEFGQNVITLDRDLHDWLASFRFARAPNGNTIFQVSISLKAAPDVRTEYQQRTN